MFLPMYCTCRCIMKMDHHCPWINSCVGYGNHAYFTRFLFFVPFGCIHAVIINSNFLYRLFTYVSRERQGKRERERDRVGERAKVSWGEGGGAERES